LRGVAAVDRYGDHPCAVAVHDELATRDGAERLPVRQQVLVPADDDQYGVPWLEPDISGV
jgi:hypothetical protein